MIGFLQDAPDSWSWTRLALSILLVWWCVLIGYLIFSDKLTITNSAFMSGYLAAILGAKVWSKNIEVKGEITEAISKDKNI